MGHVHLDYLDPLIARRYVDIIDISSLSGWWSHDQLVVVIFSFEIKFVQCFSVNAGKKRIYKFIFIFS